MLNFNLRQKNYQNYLLVMMMMGAASFYILHNSIPNIPIYVVSLERAIDRKNNIRKQLGSSGYTIFRATDGAKMTSYEEELGKKWISPNTTMPPPQIGCFISHVRLSQTIIENNYKYAVIFEDDMKPYINLRQMLPRLIAFDDYDILYLGHYFEEKSFDVVHRIDHFELHRSVHPLCTHGYIISQKAAKYLVEWLNHQKWHLQIDHLMRDLIQKKELKALSSYPRMIRTAQGLPSLLMP